MSSAFFVTGTDTGVGKTFVTCALIRYFADQGCVVAGYKPVAAGGEWIDGILQNEDGVALWQAGSLPANYAEINPVCLATPASPHIAAKLDLVLVDGALLLRQGLALAAKSDVVFAEGAGGWRVPLAPGLDISTLAQQLAWPVLLVVGVRLGCINHARLTLEAMRHDGVEVAGWFANLIDPELTQVDRVLSSLQELLDAPLLATVDFAGQKLDWTDAGQYWQKKTANSV